MALCPHLTVGLPFSEGKKNQSSTISHLVGTVFRRATSCNELITVCETDNPFRLEALLGCKTSLLVYQHLRLNQFKDGLFKQSANYKVDDLLFALTGLKLHDVLA